MREGMVYGGLPSLAWIILNQVLAASTEYELIGNQNSLTTHKMRYHAMNL